MDQLLERQRPATFKYIIDLCSSRDALDDYGQDKLNVSNVLATMATTMVHLLSILGRAPRGATCRINHSLLSVL